MSTQRVRLATYDNSWYQPGSFIRRTAWFFLGQPLVRSMIMPSSALRVFVLRLFGARIGEGVTVKPGVNVKYPWFLTVGNDCWIGERCWIDNLSAVRLGNDVCLSQDVYLCTGNHNWSDPSFGLMIAPIHCYDGSWAAARSMLGPGSVLSEGAVAGAGAVVNGTVPPFEIHSGNPARFVRQRTLTRSSSLPHQEIQP